MKYPWVVIGAGPGGILSVAKLIDSGITEILWIDEKFQVGRIGQYYKNVPSNDTIKDWIDMLNSYQCLSKFGQTLSQKYGLESNQPLGVIYHIFADITKYLQTQVKFQKGHVKELKYQRNQWYINIKNQHRVDKANKVILATGSHPIELNYQTHLYNTETIPLDLAIDQQKLAEYVDTSDTVAVIGSGQSAVLLLKYLTDLKVDKIINLHKITLEETVNTLKALTKRWALNFLASKNKNSILRVSNSSVNREKWLPQCTKIIYAVGYERNPLPKIRGTSVDLEANDGILGQNLFGVGIAFPATEKDRDGHIIKRVGFTSFTRFLEQHFETWLEI